ncbi:MAG: porin, partial [Pseudolabrys sp.]
ISGVLTPGGVGTILLPETTGTADAWAVGGGVKFNVPMLGAKDYVIVQAAYSEGVLSYVGQGINGGFNLNGDNNALEHYIGPAFDAVVLPGGSFDKTKAWSVTGGFEHWWAPKWRSSLYGAYGKLEYSDAASAVLQPLFAGTAVGSSASWSYSQIGSRTVFTPVENLDLSVEVMYNNLQGAFATAPGSANTYGDKDWVSGIFRVQRNFYP